MPTLLIAVTAGLVYLFAYQTYGKWLSRTIFRLDQAMITPSVSQRDDCDFVPTDRGILFGHHFTSIAGTGPIVGPAIAVMWGWLPALIWVLAGSIFIGAVHDLGSLVVSMRSRGQTVGDVAGQVINRRVRLLFLLVLFMALTIVLAIFGLVIAAVFKQYPAAIIPCLVQIPIAVAIGSWLHRKGANLLVPSIAALATMYVTVVFGNEGVLGQVNAAMASWSILTWVVLLLAYSYVASVLPVWLLLQPRDYINSLQLITTLGMVVTGLFAAGLIGGLSSQGNRVPLELVAPMVRFHPEGAPAVIPFLFITIACGACSGFHCLVSSGTSSKQIQCETDAHFIGYGSMLTEGFLATLVILACVSGLGLGSIGTGGELMLGEAAYNARYETWASASGLAAKIGAFVDGSANFLKAIWIPPSVAVAMMGVLVASFAGTTLDTACRLQRYVVQELASTFMGTPSKQNANAKSAPKNFSPFAWLTNKHGATLFAVSLAFIIASLPPPGTPVSLAEAWAGTAPPSGAAAGVSGAMWWFTTYGGKGGLILWPLFGATNQLLAGLAFLVISFFLWRRGMPVWFIVLPMCFMLIVPAWAMLTDLPNWIGAEHPNWVAIFVGSATLILEFWMVVEALILWPKVKGVLETIDGKGSNEDARSTSSV